MLGLKTKKELSVDAHNMAQGFSMVRYREVTYLPVDYVTGEHDPAPDPERTMWLPVNRKQLEHMARVQFQTLFASDGELASFDFMVAQNCTHVQGSAHTLLVKTDTGLRELNAKGVLAPVTGVFRPNTVAPFLNMDAAAQQLVFDTISEWLDSEEEATSLLHHLATALAPGYAAVKYVLLLGEGRNGKGTLLKMMHMLFGDANVSSVTRQEISTLSPVVTQLNGKLLNLVYDGQQEYLKDSGSEKTLIAGEPVQVRKLYESTPTQVQTSALFVEALNKEPKSNDKTSALQKRLIRFQFPNVYALDHGFARKMTSDVMIGAFLGLLVKHYVPEDKLAELLAPTAKAMELQLEHMYVNSVALQFLKYIEEHDTLGVVGLLDQPIVDLVPKFQSWRIKENDLGTWAEPDVVALFNPLINTERRSVRTPDGPRKQRVATSLKDEAAAFLESLKGVEDGGVIVDGVDEAALVAD